MDRSTSRTYASGIAKASLATPLERPRGSSARPINPADGGLNVTALFERDCRRLGHGQGGGLCVFAALGPLHAGGDPRVDLAEELVDEDPRLDLAEDLSVRVDEARLATARDAEICIARLAGAVDRAAEHRDLEVLRVVAEALLDRLGERLLADVVAPARRARDQDRSALAQPERLEDLPRDPDLLDGVGGEADPNRVADSVDEQRPEPDRALDRPCRRRARLGDAEVEWIRHPAREDPVGADHRRHVTRLDGDLEVAVVELLEQPHLLERRLDQCFGLILVREALEVLRQRAGICADAHRGVVPLRRLDDLLDLVRAADVAGVDPDGGDSGLDRLE